MFRLMSPHSLLAAVKVLRNGGYKAVKKFKVLAKHGFADCNVV
jgi:hypothetical protein